MAKYLKKFETASEYSTYLAGEPLLPNVSLVDEWGGVRYNQNSPAPPVPQHDYVDLGLRSGGNKILFATCNIGASSPDEAGDYFAWGEISKRYSSISYITNGTFDIPNTPFHTGDNPFAGWSKYVPTGFDSYSVSGTADNLLTLESTDDIASVMWGGEWRMPSMSELEMLIGSDVDYEWVTNYHGTGNSGYLITGKGSFSSASLYLDAGGYCSDYGLEDLGYYGAYWSRTVVEDSPSDAWYLGFEDGDESMGNYSRGNGLHIRPVLVIPE